MIRTNEQHSKPNAVPVVLRASDPASRRYITVLPNTLDALLLKARSLFPVPPNHTPYITLDQDDQTVILEDALPFVREREVLVFRWSPDTPRKGSGNRVKWDVSVVNGDKSTGSSTPSSSASRSGQGAEAVSTGENKSSPNSNTQQQQQRLTQAQQNRAAHAKRVLEEQRRLREEEEARERAEAEERRQVQEEEEKRRQAEEESRQRQAEEDERKAALEKQEQEQQRQREQEAAERERIRLELEQQNHLLLQARPHIVPVDVGKAASASMDVPSSSPPPYSSPHTSQQRGQERETTPQRTQCEDSQDSSPLVPSPTSHIHAAVVKASMSPLGDRLVAGRTPSAEHRPTMASQASPDRTPTQESLRPSARSNDMQVDDKAEEDSEQLGSDAELEKDFLLQSSESPSPAKQCHGIRDTDAAYKMMESVVASIANHPSNTAFRDPMPLDFHSYVIGTSGDSMPVDIYLITSRIKNRMYGTTEKVPIPIEAFKHDLKRLWYYAREFYGPRSPQGLCASVLEKFSEVIVAEWRLRSTPPSQSNRTTATIGTAKQMANGNGKGSAKSVNEKEEARRKAAALMASWSNGPGALSPASRGEKRPAPDHGGNIFNARIISGGGAQGNRRRARPSKQPRLSFPSEKSVNMSAFHRAMMGGDEAVKTVESAPEQPQAEKVVHEPEEASNDAVPVKPAATDSSRQGDDRHGNEEAIDGDQQPAPESEDQAMSDAEAQATAQEVVEEDGDTRASRDVAEDDDEEVHHAETAASDSSETDSSSEPTRHLRSRKRTPSAKAAAAAVSSSGRTSSARTTFTSSAAASSSPSPPASTPSSRSKSKTSERNGSDGGSTTSTPNAPRRSRGRKSASSTGGRTPQTTREKKGHASSDASPAAGREAEQEQEQEAEKSAQVPVPPTPTRSSTRQRGRLSSLASAAAVAGTAFITTTFG